MAKRKSPVRTALTDAHLKAIGAVAAQWSLLELRMLQAISLVSNVSIQQALILAGPSHFPVWMDMLRRLTTVFPSAVEVDKKIDRLKKRLEGVHRKRNQVVHAAWMREDNLGDSSEVPYKIATGTGLPKSGKIVLIELSMTAADIRGIRHEIEEAERSLVTWLGLRQLAFRNRPLVQALRKSENLVTNQNEQQDRRPPSLGLFGLAADPEKK